MSATKTKTLTWPTIGEVDRVLKLLTEAHSELDRFNTRCHKLIDHDDQWEKPESVPAPTFEDVGVLAYFVDECDSLLAGMGEWVGEFRERRDSAGTFAQTARRAVSS